MKIIIADNDGQILWIRWVILFQLPFLYGFYILLLICMPIFNPFLFKKNILNPFLLHCNFLGLVAKDVLYVHRRTMLKVQWVENLSGLDLDAYWPYVFSHRYQCMIVSLFSLWLQVCKWADVSRINAQKRKSLLLHHRLHSYFSRFHNHISNCLHLFIIECFHCSIGFDSSWLEEELMKVAPYSQLGKNKNFLLFWTQFNAFNCIFYSLMWVPDFFWFLIFWYGASTFSCFQMVSRAMLGSCELSQIFARISISAHWFAR